MSTDRLSMDRAFHEAAGENSVLGAEGTPEQLDMLRQADGRLPDNVFRVQREQATKRGPGRPRGSLNRRTVKLADLVVQQHGDPVLAMASIYAMPLDQLCELLLIADGTQARQREVDVMLGELAERVAGLTRAASANGGVDREAIERLADACEALEGAARRSQGKPGEVAIKALKMQIDAARAVAEYVHSRKPVEVAVSTKADAVLVFPGMPSTGSFDALDEATRQAAAIVDAGLASGALSAPMLADMRIVQGRLVDQDGHEPEGDEPEGDEP